MVGAGDIAECSNIGDEITAALLDNIPGTILALGDIVYPDGSAADYTNCYDPSWGRHKARTRPAPGRGACSKSRTSGRRNSRRE